MQFDWDRNKARTNLREHDVAFEDAISVFADALARIFVDPGHSGSEQRELMAGYDSLQRLPVTSFVERGDNVRIVSARRATARETHAHEEHIKQASRH